MLENLMLGISTAFQWHNVLFCFIGVFIGNVIGVLPGIGALAALSMLLPVTYGLEPVTSLTMLAGIYYGTSFGGATTAILLNLPGTVQHAVICLDGHPLARQGRAGPAIFVAMFASFFGVCIGIVAMTLFSPLVTRVAFSFGAPDYFSLMLLALIAASMLGTGSPLKAVASVVIGLFCGVVGIDVNSGVSRFDFGLVSLQDGISLVALAMALFGVVDILRNVGVLEGGSLVAGADVGRRALRPSRREVRQSVGPAVRGAGLGSFFGALPGTGGTLASFLSYALEKKLAKNPSRFGNGAMETVSGAESANSAADITAFIPTLTLGIPGDATMALMLGALMIHNITPGPQVMVQQPALFWGLVMSFWLGNGLLLLLNIPLIRIWVKLLTVPYRIIYPVILFLICIGVYSANNALFDVGMVLALGILGYFLISLGFQGAPLLLGFVLGPMLEENFRRALLLSRGGLGIFLNSPISAACILASVVLVFFTVRKQMRAKS